MKIKFNNGKEYQVFQVSHSMDNNDEPVDIVIYGTKEVLEEIANYASIGISIQECDWVTTLKNGLQSHYKDYIYEVLYARLQPFIVKYADKVQYIERI